MSDAYDLDTRAAPAEDHEAVPPPADFSDPLEMDEGTKREAPRRRFELDDTGFKEVPKRWRRFYRRWHGDGDSLAPNEVLCPVCKVVIRSKRELRPGDRVYCMPCMARLVVAENRGRLEATSVY